MSKDERAEEIIKNATEFAQKVADRMEKKLEWFDYVTPVEVGVLRAEVKSLCRENEKVRRLHHDLANKAQRLMIQLDTQGEQNEQEKQEGK